tara:strand:+ start:3294 stop:3419 length:126 start_codon:yes stop_codon:yes gene_type:complete
MKKEAERIIILIEIKSLKINKRWAQHCPETMLSFNNKVKYQ